MNVAPFPTVAPELACVAGVRAALASGVDSGLSAEDARRAVAEWARVESQIAARKMALLRRIDDSTVVRDAGATSTGSLISADFGGDQASAARQVRTAKNLKVATLTEQALEAGEITFEKAEVIARTIAGLPHGLDEMTVARVERGLIADAIRFTLTDLRRRVLRVADLYASREQADRDESETLRAREARAWQNTRLWSTLPRDGLVKFGGELPEAAWAMFKNQLDAIAAPRRRHEGDEELSHGQRLGRAFSAWIERIPTDGLPTTGGTPATITINLDYDALKSEVVAATLANGTRISATELRRLACGANILPRVLGGRSEVVDQGRAKRLFTPAQRLALADRDRGCTYPGCDRPPGWAEAHHLDWWARDGGNTNLNDGALLCARHHHQVHEHNLDGRVQDGHVQWRLNGIWQTNHRWRT